MKKYTFSKDIIGTEAIFHSFNQLAGSTFGIDFEAWKNNGYWGSRFIPHVLMDDGKVIANISVNTMDLICNGKPVKAVQLGTVMTDISYRNQGLSRQLMENILQEYQDKCDFFYLFANDSVLDFYPRFGFQQVWEYRTFSEFCRSSGGPRARKIDMNRPSDKAMFLRLAGNAIPFAKISMVGNLGLIMFYCGSYRKDNLYYIPEMDIAAVAEFKDPTMFLHDIFSEKEFDFTAVVSALLPQEEMKVVFGFTPPDCGNFQTELKNDDADALFVKINSGFPFGKEMFPVLSHA